MAVSHNDLKSAISNAFDKSDIKFSKVSDLTRDEFERLLASAIKACLETHDFSNHIRNIK